MNTISAPSIRTIINNAESSGARIGLCVVLPDGSRLHHRENELFMAASTIKIAIMVEVFRRIDTGELSLDQLYELKDQDRVPGSGVLQELHAGIKLTLYDLLYLMMSISDNPATNILTAHVGMDAVNATMRQLGMQRSLLARPMRGRPAIDSEQENLATPAEFAALTASILSDSAASSSSCAAMRRLMELQSNNRRIGRFVSAIQKWGSKTGSYATVVHDVGFVMTQKGPLIIAAFSEDVADVVTGEIIISELVREALKIV